jgi:hypothetical protein
MPKLEQLPIALARSQGNLSKSMGTAFAEVERRATPKFRDAAKAAAGPDRRLSGHKSKAKLDVQFRVPKTTRETSTLFVKPVGPWGIRDSTDAATSKTAAHVIVSKQGKFLRFSHNGRIVYAKVTNHPGSRRSPFWARGRKEALLVAQKRIPEEASKAIEAGLWSRPYASRKPRARRGS